MYARRIKRPLDAALALVCALLLSPVLLVLTAAGAVALRGNPFFLQDRPGREERLFRMLKFRSMTRQRGADGRLLPDAQRLTRYGRFLRNSSLDELPELWNILRGDMSFVGPRPLLVRDMLFMTDEQRRRHSVRPGLTGLAQVSGRNALRWERKLELDLEYLGRICFRGDAAIVLRTARLMLCGGQGEDETDVTLDLGDYLLEKGVIDRAEYERRLRQADTLLEV